MSAGIGGVIAEELLQDHAFAGAAASMDQNILHANAAPARSTHVAAPSNNSDLRWFVDPMLGMLDHLRRAGFIHSGHLMRPIVVDRVEAIIPAIVAAEEIERTATKFPQLKHRLL